jgi:hypothetical protein
MKLHRRKMLAARVKRKAADDELRSEVHSYCGWFHIQRGFWRYVLVENNRGLLEPREKFPTLRAALRWIDEANLDKKEL